MQGSVIALAVFVPARASAPPSLRIIAEALQAGRAADAESMATQMLAIKGYVPLENMYLLLDRGLAREQLHQRQEAVSDFTAAINSGILPPSEFARAVFDRGVILDELGRTEEAIVDYSHAIRLSPRYAAALNNRGNAYRRLERYTEARADYQAALTAGDNEPEYPLYGLGRVAEAQDDPAAAKMYYERALAANSAFVPASDRLSGLGRVPEEGNYYTLRPPGPPAADATNELVRSDAAKPADFHQPEPVNEDALAELGLRPAFLGTTENPVRITSAMLASSSSPSRANGGDIVQLGAWRNKDDAALGWDRLTANAGALLDGATPQIFEADVPGKGHFWRLRTRAPSGTSANVFCAKLRAKGLNCIAIRS